jgi:hypothetical protein
MTPSGTANLDGDTRRVKIGGKPVFNTDSVISSCNGNEPGTQKEVVSQKTGSSAYMLDGSPDVKVEGKSVVYTGSQGMGNQM